MATDRGGDGVQDGTRQLVAGWRVGRIGMVKAWHRIRHAGLRPRAGLRASPGAGHPGAGLYQRVVCGMFGPMAGGMRIAVARRGYSPSGGAERYLLRLAGGLAGQGHEVRLVTTDDWPDGAWEHGPMDRLAARGAVGFADAVRAARPGWRADVFLSLERVWECDVYRAGDGVHAAWMDRRAVFGSGWGNFWRRARRVHREVAAIERALFGGGAGKVIANSRMVADEIVRYFGYPADRIVLIPNGYTPAPLSDGSEQSEREGKRRQIGAGPDTVVVLFIGSGWERKRLRDAVEAVARLDDPMVQLVVAGRGKRRGIPACPRVNYLGEVSAPAGWYEAADLFILPTLYDPFSNASLEAARHGLPVLTTSANGFADLIRAGTPGFVVEPGDMAGMAAGLKDWVAAVRGRSWRAACADSVRALSVEANVEATLAVLGAAG